MNRSLLAMMVPLLAVSLVAIWLFGGEGEALTARFAAADCRRLDLATPEFDRLVGIEDVALLPDGQLLLSAHDRGDPAAPGAGIFVLPFLPVEPSGTIVVQPLPGVAGSVAALRPHGIAVGGRRLAFVNRPAPRTAEVVWGGLDGFGFEVEGRWEGAEACRANDLAWSGGSLLVTRDRGACGTAMEDLMPGARTGSVVALTPGGLEVVADGLSFPNGIAIRAGAAVVAETRADRLTFLADGWQVAVPGGPDNLSEGPAGQIVAAVHPTVFGLFLHASGAAERSGSRVVAIDPASGAVEVLFDDPDGRVFSAASVAVLDAGRLVVGSARDAGLLVCGG